LAFTIEPPGTPTGAAPIILTPDTAATINPPAVINDPAGADVVPGGATDAPVNLFLIEPSGKTIEPIGVEGDKEPIGVPLVIGATIVCIADTVEPIGALVGVEGYIVPVIGSTNSPLPFTIEPTGTEVGAY
jgi:hypothetical protein